MDFVVNGAAKMLSVCANHFTPDRFGNERQHSAWSVSVLKLKYGSLLTVHDLKSQEDASCHYFYCFYG